MSFPGALPASMGKRVLAYVIDGAVATVLGGAFLVAGTVQMLDAARAGRMSVPALTVVGSVVLLALGLFQWWYQAERGYTIGKRAVGLRTLAADTGRPVGLGRILVRYLVVAAGTLVVGVGQLVVYASPLFDPTGRRQGWHDKAAGTMVFDVGVGVDPTREPAVSVSDAARRVEALLAAPVPVPAGPVPPPVGPPLPTVVPSPPPAPEPAEPVEPVEPAPEPVAVASSAAHVPPPPPSSAPLPVAPQPPSESGLISSVPLSAGATVPRPSSTATGPLVDHIPAALVSPGLASHLAAGERPLDEDVDADDDVDATRLRHPVEPDSSVQQSRATAGLRLWDGRRVTLVGTALIGRNPGPRDGESAPAHLLSVADGGRSVSKTHLAVGVDAVGVWVRDRSSTNGTVVTLPDGQQVLCAAEQEVRVPSGASVAFGDYWLTVI